MTNSPRGNFSKTKRAAQLAAIGLFIDSPKVAIVSHDFRTYTMSAAPLAICAETCYGWSDYQTP
ncbi:MAG: hypothetical protein U0941_12695 [Planctomycetaceae bacterium]